MQKCNGILAAGSKLSSRAKISQATLFMTPVVIYIASLIKGVQANENLDQWLHTEIEYELPDTAAILDTKPNLHNQILLNQEMVLAQPNAATIIDSQEFILLSKAITNHHTALANDMPTVHKFEQTDFALVSEASYTHKAMDIQLWHDSKIDLEITQLFEDHAPQTIADDNTDPAPVESGTSGLKIATWSILAGAAVSTGIALGITKSDSSDSDDNSNTTGPGKFTIITADEIIATKDIKVGEGTLTLKDGSITDSSNKINFGTTELSTSGTLKAGVATLAQGTVIGNLQITSGSISNTSNEHVISFGNDNVSTSGTLESGSQTVAGAVTAGSFTDGTATLTGGALSSATTVTASGLVSAGSITASGAVTGGSLTDGTATLTGGALSSATTVTASGAVTGGSLTDGTATLTGGALSSATTVTASGLVSAGSITASGAVTAGSFTDGTATMSNGTMTGLSTMTASGLVSAGSITASGAVTGGSLDIDDVVIDGSTIGHTSDANLMTLSNETLTVAGALIVSGVNGNLDVSGSSHIAGYAKAGSILTPRIGTHNDVLAMTIADNGKVTTSGDLSVGTSLQTATIDYTDGDLAMTISDGGAVTIPNNLTAETVDINGGTVDGATIGANSTSTGAFTTVTASGAVTGGSLTTLGAVTGGSLTDGTATLTGGALTGVASIDITGSTGLILENDETITNSVNGTVLINGTVAAGTGSAAGIFQSSGDNDLTLKTGNSITGSITITDGANGDITITPNGTGEVNIFQVDIDRGTIDGTAIGLTSQSTGAFTTASMVTATIGTGGIILQNGQTITNEDPNIIQVAARTTEFGGHLKNIGTIHLKQGRDVFIKMDVAEATVPIPKFITLKMPTELAFGTTNSYNIVLPPDNAAASQVLKVGSITGTLLAPNVNLAWQDDTNAAPSDQRVKTNIQDLTETIDPLSIINQLDPVTFEFDEIGLRVAEGDQTGTQIGLIAQDVAAVLPSTVITYGTHTDDVTGIEIEDFLYLEQNELTTLNIAGIQALDEKIIALEEQLNADFSVQAVFNLTMSHSELNTATHSITAVGSFQTIDDAIDLHSIEGGSNGDILLLMSNTDTDWTLFDMDTVNNDEANIQLSTDSLLFDSSGDSIELIFMNDTWYEKDYTDIQ